MSLRPGTWVQPLCAVVDGFDKAAPHCGQEDCVGLTVAPHQLHRPLKATGGAGAGMGGDAMGAGCGGGAAATAGGMGAAGCTGAAAAGRFTGLPQFRQKF